MPSATRLVAALAFAMIAFFGAELYKTALGAQYNFGAFSALCALIGVICGWTVCGPAGGRGWIACVIAGLRTSFTIVVFGLVFFSVYEMLTRAWHGRYSSITGALESVFGLFVQFAKALVAPEPLIVLILGGLLGGLLVEWTYRQAHK